MGQLTRYWSKRLLPSIALAAFSIPHAQAFAAADSNNEKHATVRRIAAAVPFRTIISLRQSSRSGPLHMVVTRPDDIIDPEVAPDYSAKQSALTARQLGEFVGFLAISVAAACLLISWEDLTCSNVLPSRHRTSLSLFQRNTAQQPSWGASTVHGMGFGFNERQQLLKLSGSSLNEDDYDYDPLASVPSYNEVMLKHRTETLPQWKQAPTAITTQAAIHTVTTSLQKVWMLQAMAEDYQWEAIRSELHAAPLSNLPAAAAVLRQTNKLNQEVVGFDWGSCALRHCGAVADAQEALDELDQLLGVLEPYEAIFCLDICDRSLRDILAVVPWQEAAEQDAQFYSTLPVYVSKISANEADADEGETTSRIDDAYFKALQELRID